MIEMHVAEWWGHDCFGFWWQKTSENSCFSLCLMESMERVRWCVFDALERKGHRDLLTVAGRVFNSLVSLEQQSWGYCITENSLRYEKRLHCIIFQVRLILSSYIMFYRSWRGLRQGPGAKLSYLLMEVGLLEQPTKTYLLFSSTDMRDG